MTDQDLPVLHHFRLSMYPEKVRWVLDYKQVPHRRKAYLPGPHALPLMWLSGQKSTPVLTHDGQTISDSPKVLEYIEQQWPEPALFPRDPAQLERALEIAAWFDDVGPAARRAAFYEYLPHGGYMADRFSTGYSDTKRKLYRAAFPAIRVVMKMDMQVDKKGAEVGRKRTEEALDYVAENAGPEGYLAGGSFSVADLTAATVLHITCMPKEYPVAFPEPRPAGVQNWLARWQDHPGTEWVREMYRRHRSTSAAVAE